MTTYKRICLKDFEVKDINGYDSFTIKKGKEYITSKVDENKNLVVFSKYWCYNIPADIFEDGILFTGT